MWYKGLRIILDAMARLQAAGKDFRMVFVGQGGDFEAVTQYARELGLGNKCIFTGAIQGRESLQGWYCRADLFLFPSTFDTNGLVVREAAASSLASVLVKGSCAAEDVTDGVNGFLIEENAESLANLLLELEKRPGFAKVVGHNAADQLYLSWENAVKIALDRYQIVTDRYRLGEYHPHRKPMEYFLKANGELMEDMGHLVRLRDQLRQHRKDHLL